MRHKIKTDRLGRFSSHRKATIKSLVISVLINQKIITTKAKAKSARGMVERMITLGKKDTLFARRRAFSLLSDHLLVKKLFDQIAPLFANRAGGYTRIIPYRYQRGDNAQLVILELTEQLKKEKIDRKVKEEKKAKPGEVEKEEPKVAEKEKPAKAQGEVKQESKPRPKKEKLAKPEVKPKPKKEEAPALKEKPPVKIKEEEKKPEVKPEEKPKPEEKKPKGLFGGFKNLFKKKDSK